MSKTVRFLCGRFCDARLQPFEQLVAVNAFFRQHSNCLSRIVFVLDDDTAALPAQAAQSFRSRTVNHITRGPNARTADAAVTHAFPLGGDPLYRIVGDSRAGRDAK